MKYNHKKIESKWQERWERDKIYQPDLDKKLFDKVQGKPFYNLMMFPYPSAEGLHIGNMYAFVHSDTYGRFMRLRGFDVFEPIGLDGFGIHSENYAIKIGEHIKDVSARTEKKFYQQLHKIGNQYDWSRTVETYKPNYYKWTQWLFLKMYEKGLAYRKKAAVNWCPGCKTVLSDEQVISDKCERCGTETEKKQMEQWFWKITDYAEKLLNNLKKIDWSEEVKIGQRNWIGSSEGMWVDFMIVSEKVKNKGKTIFTTRPDTLFGTTFFVLSPEDSSLIEQITTDEQKEEVEKYIKEAMAKSDLERIENKEKTGVFTGAYAVNPVNGEKIPVWIADYVLFDYGGGAVMAVPAHDQRDWEFAKKYSLPIIEVLKGGDIEKEAFVGDGPYVNSGFLDDLKTKKEGIKKMTEWLEKKMEKTFEGGERQTAIYKLRDWCISRQRYWGPPIPLVFCENCAERIKNHESGIKSLNKGEMQNPGWFAVPEEQLPVLLPEMDDFLPDGSGKGPLNKVQEFVNTTCPKCKGPAKRETDVSDPFVDSCWYFLRYLCTDFDDKPLDKLRMKKWMPVDMYIGGREHTVLHLLYSRFVSMVLHELGYLSEEEPFEKFRAHGLLIREGAKISKSKGNIVNPDEYIEKFGADSIRLYLMFLGDMRQGGDWQDAGIIGVHRFLKKIYRLISNIQHSTPIQHSTSNIKLLHRTIKKVTEDLENLKFNTAISSLMILTNAMEKDRELLNVGYWILVIMLAPFAPHIAEELWEQLDYKDSIHKQAWPEYDPKKIEEETIELVVQINGKFRGNLSVSKDISQKQAEGLVLENDKFRKYLQDKSPSRVVFVKNRPASRQGGLINFVT